MVWTTVVDKTCIFYEPKEKFKSEIDKQKDKLPYFKTYKECNDWCEYQNEEMFQDRMIKKYSTHINEQHILDPYGEDNWEIPLEDIKVGDFIRKKSDPYKEYVKITKISGIYDHVIFYDKEKTFMGWLHFITKEQLKKWLEYDIVYIDRKY